MCVVSDKLKLCTCKNAAETLKHYWVLYRFVNGKQEEIMGMPVLPAIIDPETDTINQQLLLKLLNEGNAFDEPLYPVHKDRLLLSFTLQNNGSLNYGFLYQKNKWQIIDYDYFEWHARHNEIKEGKIKNGLKKINNRL